jgi:hypothetical protein
MKTRLLIILLSGLVLYALPGQNIEKQCKEILTKADKRFFPEEGTYELLIADMSRQGEETLTTLQMYKKGKTKLTSVYVYPEVMKNNVGIRNGDTIYYKPRKAAKPDIMSYQAVFMDSTLTWGDVLWTDLVEDYKTVKIDNICLDGTDCYLLQLAPVKPNRYARIDVWVDRDTYYYKKMLYYTASGYKFKQAVYTILEQSGGKVKEFRVNVEDFFMQTKNYAQYSKIKQEKLPSFLFDVKNIGRIHAR